MSEQPGSSDSCDFLVIGSGSAALSAALRAAKGGLAVIVLEKSERLGGTSAMSGAGIWIPANHVARAAGVQDSPEEALAYLRATAPEGWAATEDGLWQAFARNAPRALEFIDANTPLEFVVTKEPDPFSEYPGGKLYGRQLTVEPISKWTIGALGLRVRASTLPHLFSYQETVDLDPYHHPVSAGLKLLPRLIWRLLANSRGQGNALITGLLRGCLDLGVSIRPATRALRLVQDSTGRVIGAEVESRGRRRTIEARRGVLLATGGFDWDDAMRERHFPGGVKFLGAPSSNTGDGQRMAADAGARLDRLDQANVYPCLPTTYEGRLAGMPMTFTAERHSILVNRHGNRFVSENDFNIGERIDQRDPRTGEPVNLPVWLIGDRRFLRQSPLFRWYARKLKGFLVQADSIEALAARIGLPPAQLAETVSRFNWFCDQGSDQDFRRGQSAWDKYKTHGEGVRLAKLEEGPFVAVEVSRSILGTKGGARTDDGARVLRADGSVIDGLFAAGLAMANPFGTRAVGAGTTIGPNLTWGFICAETVLSQPERTGE
ncbi:MAG: FAD-dependent oxidoreductase [Alphaproteobacteria bacterium]|nr:FAD-dependent oxidoreductase [Alphaproteobacteria bacterium]